MSTMTVPEIPLEAGSPAHRLRRIAAAVRVHFTWWGVHRTLTAQQKEEVGLACNADTRLLTAGKKLVDTRHPAFRQLTSLRGRVVQYWRGLTLPYIEPGIRLIRQTDIEPFVQTLEGFAEDLREAEVELNEAYEQIKADARQRLGRLFNPSDYPVELRGLFSVSWDFPAIEPPSYLMRLNPAIYQQEQDRVAQRFEEAVRLAEQAFVSEFAKVVEHLCERLANDHTGDRKVFRDSAVENLTEFFQRFKRLNVNSCRELDDLVDQAQNLVRGIQPQDLRESDQLRTQVASQLTRVQATLDGLLVDRPRRNLIRQRSGGGS